MGKVHAGAISITFDAYVVQSNLAPTSVLHFHADQQKSETLYVAAFLYIAQLEQQKIQN